MRTSAFIENYIQGLDEPKRSEVKELHALLLKLNPNQTLRFLDGKNSEGKVVSNPNIGYGTCKIKYADGSEKEFYRIGLSANSTGISIYVMGLKDKNYLSNVFANITGKAKITGYCIKIKSTKDIDLKFLTDKLSKLFDQK